ncbi:MULTISPECIES: M20 family metallopeptidase [Geobacter]|uniref:M20 family metallopeptidase n=1 Tax=Geobacter TaxID=28231 RepID=UPI0025741A52|nr:M20 family metallopeptidase [Geobacter sulfurreducens]BEH08792.1 M20 family metallopeptidase [Geobacter sulfurreducens subsp. ethanolicus]BET60279.1 M20 family metallopeptidase [Geobacter sp. 60473]
MDLERIKKELVAFVDARRDDFIRVSEELFHNPETGLNEVRSAALLADCLEAEGFRVARGVAGLPTAFRADSGERGPVVGIIAEMDALPGLGHACGHNVIAAAALGAAIALRRVLPADAARLVVLGTPAEEIGVGKVEMIRHGIFDDVEFAMMVHPSSRRYVVKHYLGLAKIRFVFLGKPAHAAAYPEEGINALDGVIQTFNSVNALRQQLRQDVRVHGIIPEGGVAPNIIPERASAFFYVRADDMAELERVRERVVACARGAATATGCRLEIEEDPRVMAPLKVNCRFSDLYAEQLAYLGLELSESRPDRNKGSSDIGNVSQIMPTIHPHVPIGDGINIHSDAFARATVSAQGKAAVVEGATALALTAAELIARPELREEILREFRR